MSARRFECSDGGSDTFWEVERRGREVDVRWGRMGAAGQSRLKALSGDVEAVNEVGWAGHRTISVRILLKDG